MTKALWTLWVLFWGCVLGFGLASAASPVGFGVTPDMVADAVPITTIERLCADRPATGLSFSR